MARKMRQSRKRATREPTIALINIVFLMLIFFMVAGTLAPPLDRDLTLVNTSELDGIAPPDALIVHADGRLTYRGEAVADAAAYIADLTGEQRQTVRIVPDRTLSAAEMVRVSRALRAAGAERVVAVTERGLK